MATTPTPHRIYRTARLCFAAMVTAAIATMATHDTGEPRAMVALATLGMSMAGALHVMRRNNPRRLALLPWRKPRTMRGLGVLMARWALQELPESPVYHGGPDPETDEIADALARLNRAGLVTTQSQPQWTGVAVDGVPARQRAFVHGFCDEQTMQRIRTAADTAGLEMHAERGVPRRRHTRVAIGEWHGPNDYMFPESRREFYDTWGAHCSPEAVEELAEAWQVLVVDPDDHNRDRLWRTLVGALDA